MSIELAALTQFLLLIIIHIINLITDYFVCALLSRQEAVYSINKVVYS